MPIEYEYRYRLQQSGPLSKEAIVKRLATVTNVQGITYLLTNQVFTSADGAYVRIREMKNLDSNTFETILTVKTKDKNVLDFEEEDEVNICATRSQDLKAVLIALGCTYKYTVQKLRTVIDVPGIGELDFDEAPGLHPFLEVEACTKRKLNKLVTLLGICDKNETFGISDLYYEQYGISKDKRNTTSDLLFSKASDLKKYIPTSKGKVAFAKILAQQCKVIKAKAATLPSIPKISGRLQM